MRTFRFVAQGRVTHPSPTHQTDTKMDIYIIDKIVNLVQNFQSGPGITELVTNFQTYLFRKFKIV